MCGVALAFPEGGRWREAPDEGRVISATRYRVIPAALPSSVTFGDNFPSIYNFFHILRAVTLPLVRISIQKQAAKAAQYSVENPAISCAEFRLFYALPGAYNDTSTKGCKLYAQLVFTPSGLVHGVLCSVLSDLFALLERTIQSPDLWVHCRLDDLIPFCKYAIVPYLLWFPWILFTLFYLLHKAPRGDFLGGFCLPLFTGMTMALLFYAIVPNGLALRPRFVPGSDIFCPTCPRIYRSDTPMNVCPSIHVFNSVTLMLAYYRSSIFDAPRRRWMRPYRHGAVRVHHNVHDAAPAAQRH